MNDDPIILWSAHKHGISDDNMLHAYRNPIRAFKVDDMMVLVGPDLAGNLLEVGHSNAAGRDVIIHAMAARPRFLR